MSRIVQWGTNTVLTIIMFALYFMLFSSKIEQIFENIKKSFSM